MLAAELAWGRVPQSCRQCRGNDDETRQRRKEWGCDEPAPKPWGEIPCVECDGDDSEHCGACAGSGKTPLDRCPFVVVRAPERLLADACALVAAGVMPFTGGWLDQPATFVEALHILLRERKRHDDAAKRRRRELTGG